MEYIDQKKVILKLTGETLTTLNFKLQRFPKSWFNWFSPADDDTRSFLLRLTQVFYNLCCILRNISHFLARLLQKLICFFPFVPIN